MEKVVIRDSISDLGTPALEGYLVHALCTAGSMEFDFNGMRRVLRAGDVMIVRREWLVTDMRPTDDFRVKVIYVDAGYVEGCTPQTNYGIKGQMALYINPVMNLTAAQYELCRRDFDAVIFRHGARESMFYEEGLRCALQQMIVDFYDFHAQLYGDCAVSTRQASLLSGFFSMLESGAYRRTRDVTHYASELCVTPKYLSEVCKKVSGHGANFWINRYTLVDLSRCLRDRSLTFSQVADLFNFSSPAYFSRYVLNYLGMSPSQYRG